MSAIIFALISYLGWAVGDIFGTTATRKLGGYSTTFWSYILSLLFFGLYAPFALGDLENATLGIVLFSLLLGAFGTIGITAFNEGLRVGNASLVGTIAASFAAVTVVLSIIFLNESVTTSQAFAIFIIFLGVALSSLDLKQIKRGKPIAAQGVVLALVAMIVWGIYFTFIKIPVQQIGWFWPNYIAFTAFPLVYLFMRLRKIKLVKPNYKSAFVPLLAAIILLRIAEFSFNLGISRGLTAIVAPIAGSYPTLFAVLAFIIFKDPITKQQVLGIITTLLGIVLLSALSF